MKKVQFESTARSDLSFSKKSSIKIKSSSLNFQNNESFSDILKDETSKKQFYQDIDETIKLLEICKDQFIQNPSPYTVSEYRNILGQFLSKMSNNYSKQSFFKKSLRSKIEFKTWHTIDLRLKNLAEQMIAREIPIFIILDQMKQIQGLILDIKSY